MSKYFKKSGFTCPKSLVSAAVGLTLISNAGISYAEEQNIKDDATIEHIIITSQKRAKNLEEVPISVAAMGNETIEQIGIRELQEMDEYIPNLQISKGNSYSTVITIRGVGSSSRNIGFDSRVGVYVDGVYMGQSPATNQDILDIERIEILRGPQGTLFGKNTVAGAINMITKQPEEDFSASAKVDFGNLASRRLSGTVNVPLSDSTFTKISVNKQTRDGYVKNLPTGDLLGEQDGTSYRFQLKSELTENVTLNFSLDAADTERNLYTGVAVATSAGLLAEPEMYTANNNFVPNEVKELDGVALTLDWELEDGGAFKSITAKRDTYSHFQTDLDAGVSYAAGPLPGAPVTVAFAFGINGNSELDYTDEYEQLSQELQYISSDESALQYVAGLYFYQQEGKTVRKAMGHHDAEHPFYAGGVLPYPGDDFVVLNTSGKVDTTSVAAYVNGTYEISDKLTLGFGGRYSSEEKKADWNSDPSDSAADVLGVGVTLNAAFGFYDGDFKGTHKDTHFSPEISLLYNLDDETNVYYRASSGFKSGGFNLDFITVPQFDLGLEFDKETVLSHELGIKGSAMERRFTYNVSIFNANYENYQVQQFLDDDSAIAGAAFIGNASEVDTRGLEIEVVAQLTNNLRLTSSLGLLDAEFVAFPGGGKDAEGNVIDLDGARLAGAPDKTFNLGVQYYLPVDSLNSDLMFRLDYAYTGDRYLAGNNQEQKFRTLKNGDVVSVQYLASQNSFNARISLIENDDNWTVSLWGRNLTDEISSPVTRNVFGTNLRNDSLGRSYGMELKYNFY